MPKYDAENLLADIKTSILTTNLNTAIAAVEAEKIAQGLPVTSILPVDTTIGYFEQSWTMENLNVNPAIFYGIEDVQAKGIGPATHNKFIRFFVEVILVDSGMDKLGLNRIHRYT